MGLSRTVRRTLDMALGRRLAYSTHLYMEMKYHDLFGPNERIWDAPLIFIHIPKAAGSSILQTGVAFTRGHVGYAFYEKWLPKGRTMPRTFAVVRNPYDRFISAYMYLRNADVNYIDLRYRKRYMIQSKSIDDFVDRFVQTPAMQNYLHFLPQVNFIKNIKGELSVNEILRFETLNSEWAPFAAQHSLASHMAHQKKGSAKRPTLSKHSLDVLRSIYSDDFSCLNYER
jgi:hypothetical protein